MFFQMQKYDILSLTAMVTVRLVVGNIPTPK